MPPKRPDSKNAKNWRDCAPASLVSQGKSIQLVVVLLQSCGKYVERNSGSTEKVGARPGPAKNCLTITLADGLARVGKFRFELIHSHLRVGHLLLLGFQLSFFGIDVGGAIFVGDVVGFAVVGL